MATTYRIVRAEETEQVVELRLQQYAEYTYIEARQGDNGWIGIAFFDEEGMFQAEFMAKYERDALPGLQFDGEFLKVKF